MTNTPVPPVPSREAVELLAATLDEQLPHFSPKAGLLPGQILRTLCAEVERLNLLNIHLDRAATTIGKKCDDLTATVAEQGAALELCKMWVEDNSKAGLAIRAALASAQSG